MISQPDVTSAWPGASNDGGVGHAEGRTSADAGGADPPTLLEAHRAAARARGATDRRTWFTPADVEAARSQLADNRYGGGLDLHDLDSDDIDEIIRIVLAATWQNAIAEGRRQATWDAGDHALRGFARALDWSARTGGDLGEMLDVLQLPADATPAQMLHGMSALVRSTLSGASTDAELDDEETPWPEIWVARVRRLMAESCVQAGGGHD